jgi:hypothetical protein
MKRSGIWVPTQSDLDAVAGTSAREHAEVTCISSCRGCQCNKNPVSVAELFDDDDIVLTPSSSAYEALLGSITSTGAYAAGGCPCNCTSCNSCRCDCRHSTVSMPEHIWA